MAQGHVEETLSCLKITLGEEGKAVRIQIERCWQRRENRHVLNLWREAVKTIFTSCRNRLIGSKSRRDIWVTASKNVARKL
jgi:hypothetical protein